MQEVPEREREVDRVRELGRVRLRWEFSFTGKVKIIYVCTQQKAENNLIYQREVWYPHVLFCLYRGMLEAVWGVL